MPTLTTMRLSAICATTTARVKSTCGDVAETDGPRCWTVEIG